MKNNNRKKGSSNLVALVVLILSASFSKLSYAQEQDEPIQKIQNAQWKYGRIHLGLSMHSNLFEPSFNNIFDTKTYDLSLIPKLNLTYYFTQHIALDAEFSYAEFNYNNKDIEGIQTDQIKTQDNDNTTFYSGSLGVRYHPLVQKRLDPYIKIGGAYVGYELSDVYNGLVNAGVNESDISSLNTDSYLTLMAGVGLSYWFSNNFAVTVSSNYNYAPTVDHANFLNNAAGITYRFNKKDKSNRLKERKKSKQDKKDSDVETPNVEVADVETLNVEVADVETLNVEVADVETLNVEVADVETPNVPKHVELKHLEFYSNSTQFITQSNKDIIGIAETLKTKVKDKKYYVDGYADSTGSEAYNMQLSIKRAAYVVRMLVKMGINPNRLEPRGFGEKYPMESNKTKEGRAKNRHVEFKEIISN